MTKHQINILRMADYLWYKYKRAGLIHWAAVEFKKYGDNEPYIPKARALKNTALKTYIAFCKQHNIETGL